MPLDPAVILRLDALQSLGTSASGVSFATSTGDMLEVTATGPACSGCAWARARSPTTVSSSGAPRPARSSRARTAPGNSPRATPRSNSPRRHCASGFCIAAQPIAGSITDEHFRGSTRLPTFGRARQGGQWTAALALASGEPVYGLGEKFGPLNKRGQLIHSQVADALGVNTGLSYKNTPFAWSPGTGKGAWGMFVNTPARVTHGVGHPDWSHRSYVVQVDDEALDLFLFAADTPGGHPRPLHAGHRPAGAGPALEPGPVGIARLLQDARRSGGNGREAARTAGYPATCSCWTGAPHGRSRRASISSGIRGAFPSRAPRSRRSRRTASRLRVGIPLRVGPLAAVHRARVARLPADERGRRSLRLRLGRRAGAARSAAPARKRHRRLHAPRRVRVVARRARQSCSPTAST